MAKATCRISPIFVLLLVLVIVGLYTAVITAWLNNRCQSGALDDADGDIVGPTRHTAPRTPLSSTHHTISVDAAEREPVLQPKTGKVRGVACPKCICPVLPPPQALETYKSVASASVATPPPVPPPAPPPVLASAASVSTALQSPALDEAASSKPKPIGTFTVMFVIPAHPRKVRAARQPAQPPVVDLAGSQWKRLGNMDVDGFDIVAAPIPGSLIAMAKECLRRSTCTGFNSAGWLKAVTGTSKVVAAGVELYVKSEIPISIVQQSSAPPVEYIRETIASFVDESKSCTHTAFGRSYHAVVYNNAVPPSSFPLFETVANQYRNLSCITFVSGLPPTTVQEAPMARAHPKLKRDNARVKQTLDIIGNVQHAIALSTDTPHIVIWEDDCVVCGSTLTFLEAQLERLAVYDPTFGALKVGNGGSGVLINNRYIAQALEFVKSLAFAENFDVSIFKYLEIYRHTDYLSRRTYSAHHGKVSTFANYRWGSVKCGNDLDYWWGQYRPCPFPGMEEWQCSSLDEYGVRVPSAVPKQDSAGSAQPSKPPPPPIGINL